MDLEVARDGPVEPHEIEELRAAVGSDRCVGTYDRILREHYTHYTVRPLDGRLIGYLSVLSDGVADAFLVDLMVHPGYQDDGVGTRLVRRAVADLKRAGVQCVQVTFNEELEPFYTQCGFHVFKAGIIDFNTMQWEDV
jgi:GNAT superfamily N-acetyltransferase